MMRRAPGADDSRHRAGFERPIAALVFEKTSGNEDEDENKDENEAETGQRFFEYALRSPCHSFTPP